MAQRRTRKKVKVPLYGQVAGRVANIEDGATIGATIGTDLQLPDGSIPTLAELAIALGVGTSSASESLALARTLWSLIQEIPSNIVQLAALTTAGVIVRRGDGTIITRQDYPTPIPAYADSEDGDPGPPGPPSPATLPGMFVGTYTPGTFQIPSGKYAVIARRLQLLETERLTIAGTGRLVLT